MGFALSGVGFAAPDLRSDQIFSPRFAPGLPVLVLVRFCLRGFVLGFVGRSGRFCCLFGKAKVAPRSAHQGPGTEIKILRC